MVRNYVRPIPASLKLTAPIGWAALQPTTSAPLYQAELTTWRQAVFGEMLVSGNGSLTTIFLKIERLFLGPERPPDRRGRERIAHRVPNCRIMIRKFLNA